MRNVARLLFALVCLAPCASAQRGTPPRLNLVEEWRLDAKKEHLERSAYVAIAPDGRMFIAPPYQGGEIVAYDSSGTKKLWTLPVGNSDKHEIRFVNRIGWTGPQMWVSDRGYNHVALISDKGVVTKSIENPTFARPALSERNKYPIFEGMAPLARFADGTMLVVPQNSGPNLFDTPEFDSTATHVLRVGSNGVIQKSVARYKPEPAIVMKNGNRTYQRPVPFANRTYWGVSPDGMRLVFANAALAGKDSGTVTVVALNDRGDTLFTKRFPFTPEKLPARIRDSVVTSTPAANNFPLAAVRAEVEKALPVFFPPLRALVLGRDYTTWIAFRPPPADTGNTRWLILDARGEPIGTTLLPRRTTILAADRDHAWGAEIAGPETRWIARYRLK